MNKKYEKIVEHILNNENFVLLKNDNHHGTSKYAHCKRVSYLSYLFAKLFRANYHDVARAGLLHDFFYGSRISKDENSYLKHPLTSSKNAIKHFNINEKEQKIIESHMYHHALLKNIMPNTSKEAQIYLKNNKPNNKESAIVCISDLLVSIYEVIIYKISYSCALYTLFLINVIKY